MVVRTLCVHIMRVTVMSRVSFKGYAVCSSHSCNRNRGCSNEVFLVGPLSTIRGSAAGAAQVDRVTSADLV